MNNDKRIDVKDLVDLRRASFKAEKPSGTSAISFEYQGTNLILGYIIYDMLNQLCEIDNG